MKVSRKMVLLLLLLMTCGFFIHLFFAWNDTIVDGEEILHSGSGRNYFISTSVREGHIPLWDPFLAAGWPLYGDPTSEYFYIPLWPLFLSSMLSYYNVFLFLHIFFAGLCMYLLAREVRISPLGSIVSSVIYMFSGQLISRSTIGQLPHVATLTFYPLLFLFTIKLIHREHKPTYAIGLSVTAAFAFFAGHVQFFYYAILSLVIYYFYELGAHISQRKMRDFAVSTSFLLLSVIVFMLITMPMIISAEQFARNVFGGHRGDYSSATEGSFNPLLSARFLYPNLFGSNEHEYFFYTYYCENPYVSVFGFISIILSFYLIIRRGKNSKIDSFMKFALALLCISIFFALGKYNPAYYLFYRFLPGLSIFRLPVRFLGIAVLSTAVMAGFIYDTLFIDRKPYAKRAAVLLYQIVAILSGIALTAVGLAFLFRNRIADMLFSSYSQRSLGQQLVTINYGFVLERLQQILLHNMIYVAITVLVAIVSLLCLRLERNSKYAKWIIVAVIYFDLLLLLPLPHFIPLSKAFDPNPIESFLISNADKPGSYRVFEMQELGRDEMIREFTAHKYRIEVVTQLGQSAPLANFYLYMKSISEKGLSAPENIDKLKMLNVRYVITGEELSLPFFKKQLTYNGSNLYEFNGSQERLVVSSGKAIILDYESNGLVALVNSSSKQTVFFSEIYYPGWTATDNGKSTQIFECNTLFRCINVDSGAHIIKMQYVPRNIQFALTVAAIAWILCLLFGISLLFRRLRKRNTMR